MLNISAHVKCTIGYTLYIYQGTAMLNIRVRDNYIYISCNSIMVHIIQLH